MENEEQEQSKPKRVKPVKVSRNSSYKYTRYGGTKKPFSFSALFKRGEDALPKPVFYIILAAVYALLAFLIFYLALPRLSLRDPDFWIYLFVLLLPPVFVLFYVLQDKKILTKKIKSYSVSVSWTSVFAICFIAILTICGLSGARIFTSKSYAGLLQVTNQDKEEFDRVFDYDYGHVKLPTIDKDIAYKLAQTKLSDYGDQYQILSENFSIQSVLRDGEYTLVRVTPLEYANLFVSLGDIDKGTPGYIEVNCLTQEAIFRPVEKGIKYLDSGKFSKDLNRYIRFNYPTALTDEKYFEIDNEGNPYWIIPCHENKIGVFGGENPTSVIVLNASTGDIHNYKIGDEPDWIDHTVSLNIMMNQANDYLTYKKGFINATVGTKSDVFNLSDGYNYFIKDGYSYFVSTVTSSNENDQTSIGFLTINLKNKQTSFYNVADVQGLTEMRAREIAMQEDSVKAQKFDATWPILISYRGVPTYFLTLKNSVTVQKYCFIDVKTGLNVAIESSIESARFAYLQMIQENPDEGEEVTGTIDRINVIGDSIYFCLTDDTTKIYKADTKLNMQLVLAKTGDTVSFSYQNVDKENVITKISVTFAD